MPNFRDNKTGEVLFTSLYRISKLVNRENNPPIILYISIHKLYKTQSNNFYLISLNNWNGNIYKNITVFFLINYHYSTIITFSSKAST